MSHHTTSPPRYEPEPAISVEEDLKKMGQLFVFFPGDGFSDTTTIEKKKRNLSLSSSFCSFFPCSNFLNSPTSSTAARSTISICLLLIFITILLFTLCTFEPSSFVIPSHHLRRQISRRHSTAENIPYKRQKETIGGGSRTFALQGMGNLFRRGTRSMSDLAVCHVSENVTRSELRLFLRLLHRSGVTSKSDIVLIFNSSKSNLDSVVIEEDESFFRLIHAHHGHRGGTPTRFEVTRFVKPVNINRTSNMKEPLWGKEKKKIQESFSESTRLVYGSVVGFSAAELDPENTLSGFMDSSVPMGLRRWACYPMLLGRVRRSFKHVILLDVQNSAVIRDPLGRARSGKPITAYFMTNSVHGGRELTTAVVMGGAKGIRRLAMFLLVEIVRAATRQRGKKNVVSESSLLSEVAHNDVLAKDIDLVTIEEPIQEINPRSWSSSSLRQDMMLRSHRYRDFDNVVLKEICSYEKEQHVYRNCFHTD